MMLLRAVHVQHVVVRLVSKTSSLEIVDTEIAGSDCSPWPQSRTSIARE